MIESFHLFIQCFLPFSVDLVIFPYFDAFLHDRIPSEFLTEMLHEFFFSALFFLHGNGLLN